MMAGIYYGSMYGGSTTSILVNIPGEAASVVTCLDGHQMARQGRAGPALGIAALGSFFAGTFAIVALMLVAPALANVAIAFGPAEYFSLMVLGLTVLTFLTQGSMAKALLMACVGAVLGLIGLNSITAQPRLTFERIELYDGIGLVPVVMGCSASPRCSRTSSGRSRARSSTPRSRSCGRAAPTGAPAPRR